MEVVLPNNWEPYPFQQPVWDYLANGGRHAVCVWHRRAGKDSLAMNYLACAAMQKKGIYWHCLPTQRQARKVVWQGVDREGRRMMEQAYPEAIRKKTNETEMYIEMVNGSFVMMVGADRYDHLVGANPTGIIFSEWSLTNPSAFTYLRPILLENGGWSLMIYTPRGKNHGYTMAKTAEATKGWFFSKLTIADTCRHDGKPIISKEEVETEIVSGMTKAKAMQEYFVDFDAPVEGAYYEKELTTARADGRVGFVPIDPGLDVYTFWDLGISAGNDTAIWWVQAVGKEIRLVKSYSADNQPMSHFIRIINDFAKEHGITYGRHFAPHDIRVRELTSGLARLDTAREMGIDFDVVPRSPSIADDIEKARKLFSRCWFDERRCEDGLAALASYRREFDETNQVYREKPVHDWSSNLADAFRQMAQAWDERFAQKGATRMGASTARRDFNIFR